MTLRPPLLRGTMRVAQYRLRERCLAFTAHGWATTSVTHTRCISTTPLGTAHLGPGCVHSLSPVACRGPAGTMPRTLLLAVRFSVPNVGKWCDNNGGDDFCILRFSLSSPPVWAGLASLSELPSVNAAAYFCGPLVITRRLPSPSQAIQTNYDALPHRPGTDRRRSRKKCDVRVGGDSGL
jgi:hypothetical protein